MALFRRFFYRKPPDGLMEISERVFVFDCCLTPDALKDHEYKVYIGGIVDNLRDYSPNASFMVFNFQGGQNQSQIASILSEYDMTVMDYPLQFENCPLLALETVHHFLRSSESWLSLGQQNILLMHCEQGGWPVLAFMLATVLIYRKQYTGEQKTLDTIYKQAPRELLQLTSPLNPLPSQLRFIPNMDGEGGCRPIFRIYGEDPLLPADQTSKLLFSTPKRRKTIRHYKQAECELVKINIHCHVQGDVVLECISLDNDLEQEVMMFRVMFNTAFIRSNILMLNRDEIDTLWNAKDQFPKDFRTEVLFSEMNAASSLTAIDSPVAEEKGLAIQAFDKVQEMISNVDWVEAKKDIALTMLQKINIYRDKLASGFPLSPKKISLLQEPCLKEVADQPYSQALQQIDILLEKVESGSLQIAKNKALGKEVMDKPKSEENQNNQNQKKLDDIFKCSPLKALGKEVLSCQKPSLELDLPVKNIMPRELQVTLQRASRSKIISQRVSHTSLSTAASCCNTLQGSPVPISKYHGVPLALGITALLHDHKDSENKETTHQVTSPPAASALVPCLSKPLQSGIVSILSPSQHSPLLPPSTQVPITKTPPLPPPPPPPTNHLLALRLSSPAVSQNSLTSESDKGLQSSIPSPPTLLSSLSGTPSPTPSEKSSSAPPTPPPLPSFSGVAPPIKSVPDPPLPPSPLTSSSSLAPISTVKNSSLAPPPPPLPPNRHSEIAPSTNSLVSPAILAGPPPHSSPALSNDTTSSAPLLPLPASLAPRDLPSKSSPHVPPVPTPPAPFANGLSKTVGTSPQSHSTGGNGTIPPTPGPPLTKKGRLPLRASPRNQDNSKKTPLKPYHWLKLTRAMQGSLWAETQKSEEASKAPDFDISELESLFSATVQNSNDGSINGKSRRASGPKSDKVNLVDFRRAYNCEIMLTKVKVPLPDLMSSVLALDDSALDIDQVDNLIKFCPTKEEMELLKNYNGDKEKLGKCEQFFLELMKVPRVESKLRVFSFKLQFHNQVSELRKNLNIVNSVAEEIRNSVKLKTIMQTILSLGNVLNHGTARGSAVGFRLDSLLKLTDTRARNNRMTLMHYLCKVLAEKLPELLDFPKDLKSLEASTKIQLKYLAEEMQAVNKGLEKVFQELTASENDGPVSGNFCRTLNNFLGFAEAEVRSLASLYSGVGRNADGLAFYFGEDPARTPFEQVVSTLLNFVRMFIRAHEENCKQLELEKKRAQTHAEHECLRKEAEIKHM
ncbi:formin-like protein 18 isoform X2 [Diospyros lotus]|uniref:formin-like protein 18 isoform X2 n=1 Tax=Diospyros lotus TaxID=55363 RepID=UPI0022506097|nr:formin-like protein 18 isoform X2 [Diospyros lotus]